MNAGNESRSKFERRVWKICDLRTVITCKIQMQIASTDFIVPRFWHAVNLIEQVSRKERRAKNALTKRFQVASSARRIFWLS